MKKIILALAVLPTISFAQTLPPTQPLKPSPGYTKEDLQKKNDWVKEIEAQDFHFWFRMSHLPNLTDFRQPQEWYNPMALVDGGLTPYLPVAKPTEKPTIDLKALEAAASYAMERDTQAFIVYHKGKIRYQRYMDGYTATSALSSHSWVKTLHGMLMGFAVADGKIKSLDEPIAHYITEWKDDPRGQITIRQLLLNTSGLADPDPTEIDPMKSVGMQMVEGTNINGASLAHPLAHKPGTVFSHNNVTTQLLSMVMQRATGVRFDKYLSEKIWQPIGAQRGALRLDKPYDGNVISYCCFLSAPSDWMRVAHLLMNDGKLADGMQVLPKGWVAEMKKGSDINPNYGYQIWVDAKYEKFRPYNPSLPPEFANIHDEPFAADDLFYLDGGGKVRVWMSPKLDMIVMRMGFAPPRAKGFEESIIPNTIIRGIKK